MVQTRPIRRTAPTAKLTDINNSEQPGLSFQRKAVQDFHTQLAQDAASTSEQPIIIANPKNRPAKSPIVNNIEGVASGEDSGDGKLLF